MDGTNDEVMDTSSEHPIYIESVELLHGNIPFSPEQRLGPAEYNACLAIHEITSKTPGRCDFFRNPEGNGWVLTVRAPSYEEARLTFRSTQARIRETMESFGGGARFGSLKGPIFNEYDSYPNKSL